MKAIKKIVDFFQTAESLKHFHFSSQRKKTEPLLSSCCSYPQLSESPACKSPSDKHRVAPYCSLPSAAPSKYQQLPESQTTSQVKRPSTFISILKSTSHKFKQRSDRQEVGRRKPSGHKAPVASPPGWQVTCWEALPPSGHQLSCPGSREKATHSVKRSRNSLLPDSLSAQAQAQCPRPGDHMQVAAQKGSSCQAHSCLIKGPSGASANADFQDLSPS